LGPGALPYGAPGPALHTRRDRPWHCPDLPVFRREDEGVDDGGADVAGAGGARAAEALGGGPHEHAEDDRGAVGELAGEPGDQCDGDEGLDDGDQVREERGSRLLEVDPKVEPGLEPARLPVGGALDGVGVAGPEAGQPLEDRVDQLDGAEADANRGLRPLHVRALCLPECAGAGHVRSSRAMRRPANPASHPPMSVDAPAGCQVAVWSRAAVTQRSGRCTGPSRHSSAP